MFWLLLIVGLGLLVLIMAWSAAAHNDRTGPTGFGGWLVPIVIGQSIAPLRSVVTFINTLSYFRNIATLPNGIYAVSGLAFLDLGFIALEIATTLALVRRRRTFIVLFIVQWLALGGIFVADALILSATLSIPLRQAIQKYELVRVALLAAASGVALIYLRCARRARNTFTR